MPYKYCVVWFRRAKFWIGNIRPIETYAKCFMTLGGAEDFKAGREAFKGGNVYIYKILDGA